MQKRSVGYVRVSTEGQIEGTSLDEQKRVIEALSSAKRLNFIKHFVDEGQSGSTTRRPSFEKMMEAAKNQEFEVLVVSSVDRLGRNLRNFLETFDKLKEQGISLISEKESIDTSSSSPFGNFIVKLFSLLAEWELSQIRLRTKAGRDAKFKENTAMFGSPTYGYSWKKDQQKMVVVPERVEIYKRIVELFIDNQMSTAEIADLLHQEGVIPPGKHRSEKWENSRWQPDTVRRILKNPAYCNKAEFGKHNYKLAISSESKRTYYKRSKSDAAEGIPFEFPPVISFEKWQKIQIQMDYNRRRPRSVSRRKMFPESFLISDTLGDRFICGICGSKIMPKVHRDERNGEYRLYYKCAKHYITEKQAKRKGHNKCSLPSVRAEDANEELWLEISRRLSNPIPILKHWLKAIKLDNIDNRLETNEKAIKRYEASLNRLTDRLAETDDEKTIKSIISKQEDMSKKIDRLQSERQLIIDESTVSKEKLKFVRKFLKEIEPALDETERLLDEEKVEDAKDVEIASIREAMEKITDYQTRMKVIEAVVGPEAGGHVVLDCDSNTGAPEMEVNGQINGERLYCLIQTILKGLLINKTQQSPPSNTNPEWFRISRMPSIGWPHRSWRTPTN